MLVSLEGESPDCDEFLAAVGDDDAASELQAENSKKIAMNVKSFFIKDSFVIVIPAWFGKLTNLSGNILSTDNIPKKALNNNYLFIMVCYAF